MLIRQLSVSDLIYNLSHDSVSSDVKWRRDRPARPSNLLNGLNRTAIRSAHWPMIRLRQNLELDKVRAWVVRSSKSNHITPLWT
jgi:hypothetical protein